MPSFQVSVTLQGPKDYVFSSKSLNFFAILCFILKNCQKNDFQFGTNFLPQQMLRYWPLTFDTVLCERSLQFALFSEKLNISRSLEFKIMSRGSQVTFAGSALILRRRLYVTKIASPKKILLFLERAPQVGLQTCLINFFRQLQYLTCILTKKIKVTFSGPHWVQ